MSINERSTSDAGHRGGHAQEIAGIVLLALGLFAGASLLSLQFGNGNLMGPLGHLAARVLYAIAGVAAHFVAAVMVLLPLRLLSGRPLVRGIFEGLGFALGVFSLDILLHLVGHAYRVDGVGAGGVIGEYLAEVLRAGVSTAGTALVAAMGVLVALAITTGFRTARIIALGGRLARAVGRGARFVIVETARFIGDVVRAILPERDVKVGEDDVIDEDEENERALVEERVASAAPVEEMAGDTLRGGPPEMADPQIIVPRGRKKKMKEQVALAVAPAANVTARAANDDATQTNLPVGENPWSQVQSPKRGAPTSGAVAGSSSGQGSASGAGPGSGPNLEPATAPAPVSSSQTPNRTRTPTPTALSALAPMIVEPVHKTDEAEMKQREKAMAQAKPDFIPLGDGIYRLPPVSMLSYDDAGIKIDKDAMLEVSARLVKALNDFGVRGEVQAIRPGPVVTMYEFVPDAGTRVSKIASLADDLAMRLEAMRVRIVAPIPGKNAVGIEVPNKIRETVYLKEILSDDTFQKSKGKLTLALGKDIEGRPVSVDLAKMPHLLVAGTTGSGKSVSVNAMIMSLLFNASPEDVRLIMVDPKMLELSIYEGIPHLLLPVVTDPKKANLALKWAVEEMERRYECLAEAGVRDLASYNKKAETAIAAGSLSMKKKPYIVVIIDEFADLMMTAPKDVEMSVARIAQKARAAGIHLLLATQRPSVDVITGLIKANFPSRIAFQVASKIDSRTILDQGGADALLGQGDMLFTDRGSALKRIHGCLVQDEEIVKVVELLKQQGKPVYDMDILKPRDEDEGEAAVHEEDMSDDMYDKAVALVAESRQASISMIQRRLRIGYNRAARMVERMEREGIVGPADGPNRREVLIAAAG